MWAGAPFLTCLHLSGLAIATVMLCWMHPNPTPAEAAGRSAARNDPPVTDAVPDGDADSLDGVSVSSAVVAAAGPASVSQPDADLDSESDDDLTPSVWFVVYGLP